jgi:hypothetical protein
MVITYCPTRFTPAFFSAGRGYAWPWVNPTGSPQLYTLPAKARYDAGSPFATLVNQVELP